MGDRMTEENNEEPLVPVPMPALIPLLIKKERDKGCDLTEAEVLEIRDNAACIMLPISAKEKLAQEREYEDIDPEQVWEQWLVIKREMNDNS
jgi:hypothetical protein